MPKSMWFASALISLAVLIGLGLGWAAVLLYEAAALIFGRES
jgi:hypothetical protein